MLQRILELDDEMLDRYDLSDAQGRAGLAARRSRARSSDRWMDHFGDNLYNLYGSTEVAWATIATPEDLRAAPGTAGRPPRGTVVKLFDEDGNAGRARARPAASSSATTSRSRATRAAAARTRSAACSPPATSATSTTAGRLFVDGRDDDMIVSGGENVFPAEVEDLLAGHDDDRRGGGVRRRRRAVRAAPQGGRRAARGARARPTTRSSSYVKENLAGYKVPRDVEFVDELPRNSTGKVLKRELKERRRAAG